jgi:hypothetical protein
MVNRVKSFEEAVIELQETYDDCKGDNPLGVMTSFTALEYVLPELWEMIANGNTTTADGGAAEEAAQAGEGVSGRARATATEVGEVERHDPDEQGAAGG